MVRVSAGIAVGIGLIAAALVGCVGRAPLFQLPGAALYRYFERSDVDDPWTPKISGWQDREKGLAQGAQPDSLASVSGSGSEGRSGASQVEALRAKYLDFRAERKRAQARELAGWIQEQAKRHYRPDGAIDHWATLEETLKANGDDCDGLELLTYYLLRDLGFDSAEIYRAIVYRPDDGQHHMVTLWFEDRDDPWVIDPTGAMTPGMPRMSEVPGWVPLKVFSPTEEYTVGSLAPRSHAGRP